MMRSRRFAAAFRARESNLSVEGERGFERDKRPAGANPASEGFIQSVRVFLEDAGLGLNARGVEALDAATGDFRIRILHCGDNSREARGDDGVGAGAGAAFVAAGLETDVQRRAARFFARGLERNDFGMIAPVVLMKAFAEDFAVFDDHGADHGIGTGKPHAIAREVEGALHEGNVVAVHAICTRQSKRELT